MTVAGEGRGGDEENVLPPDHLDVVRSQLGKGRSHVQAPRLVATTPIGVSGTGSPAACAALAAAFA